MKIVITGGSGMVGRNILAHPDIKSHVVYAPTSSELNLLNYENTFDYLKTISPDLIIHAAGKVGGIQANMKDPFAFLFENLEMGKNIVIAASKLEIPRLINLGSSCMYPKDGQNPLMESSVLTGTLEPTNEGYAIAKITVAKMCEYMTNTTDNLHYKTMIPCNIYGKWDKFDPKHSHMVPAVIKKIHEAKLSFQKEVDIWGDGTARREFMYAGDLADSILFAIKHFDSMPSIVNCGLGTDYSINEYYSTIAKVIGFEGEFIHDLSKPVGMKQKVVDTTQLANWGWKASTSLEDGLKQTYNFYLDQEV